MEHFERVRELRASLHALADVMATRQLQQSPALAERYGESGRRRCVEDASFHLSFLAAAADSGLDAIFIDYVAWAKTVLVSRGVPERDLATNLTVMAEVVGHHFGADAEPLAALIGRAAEQLPDMPTDVASAIDEATASGRLARAYVDRLVAGDETAAAREVATAIDNGLDIKLICSGVLATVQREVGRLWQLNRISIATEHFCTAVAQRMLTRLCGSRLARTPERAQRLLAMCAPDEQHDLGLRAITDLLALEGWQTYFLGANVPADAAARMCADRNIDVLLISASLAPRIAGVTEVVRLVRRHPALSVLRIIVGGRAFANAPEVWRVTGADAFALEASDAIELLRAG